MSLEEDSVLIQEIDSRFSEINEALKTINNCFLTVAERLTTCENIVSAIAEAHNQLQTVDRVVYKPPGKEDHMSVKDNLDLIYERLEALEKRING